MKKILITGADSYIGTSFEKYLKNNFFGEYLVETANTMDGLWKQVDFSDYEVVFHVAGIAHADIGHISEEQKLLYYKVNTELTIQVAQKAKAEGVKQFIFMSSAIVYGDSAPIGKTKVITKDTKPAPANFYGDSKLKAEEGILNLQDNDFNVVVLRPPMIYGKGSKGNYPILSKFADKLPLFPYVKNKRSVLYVENLCEFVRLVINNNDFGIFLPQNSEYMNTSDLVRTIAKTHNKKIIILKGFAWLLKFIGCFTGLVNKAFGNFAYDKSLSEYKSNYQIYSLQESIERTEL